MAAKDAGGASKVVGMVSSLVVGSLARKVITFGWKRVTGHEPPTDPQDPDVALKEALAWSIVVGVGVEAARLLAVRMVTARMRNASADGAAAPADHRVSS
jgi:Protein of unknown function (DUF4235)